MTVMKEELVRVRCTSQEKALWQEAAGGPHRLSAYVREILNLTAPEDIRVDAEEAAGA